ncbi:protein maestro [Hemicordylus capensis]|uniref:protein maestro n=1 Tax=Hemicordylus capensis TaxID=884348 RepID=UPI0023044D56|nr:protein maestro [Hemicordylus capensis]
MRNCFPGEFPRTVVQDFLPYLYFENESCWTDCVAFFAEFVGSPRLSKSEKLMMEDVYNAMRLFIYDINPTIKMYGIRGLSNAIHTVPKQVKKYKEYILRVFMRSLSDPCYSDIRREAISGISTILSYVSSIQTTTSIQLALVIQTFFDDENSCTRQSALEIFGQLSRFFYWRKATFSRFVEKHLAPLLIHLHDPDPDVVKTTKATLWRCARFIQYKPIRNLILDFLLKEEHTAEHTTSFLKEVSRLLVQDRPGKLSRASATRAATACHLIGHLAQLDQQEEKKNP